MYPLKAEKNLALADLEVSKSKYNDNVESIGADKLPTHYKKQNDV